MASGALADTEITTNAVAILQSHKLGWVMLLEKVRVKNLHTIEIDVVSSKHRMVCWHWLSVFRLSPNSRWCNDLGSNDVSPTHGRQLWDDISCNHSLFWLVANNSDYTMQCNFTFNFCLLRREFFINLYSRSLDGIQKGSSITKFIFLL